VTEGAPALPVDPVEALRFVLDDVVNRLGRLPESRLVGGRDAVDGLTVAAIAHSTAQQLADLAAGVERRDSPQPPVSRVLPDLGPFVVSDQLAVTGTDLLAGAAGLDPAAVVWAPDGRRGPLAAVLAAGRQALEELRRRL